MSPLLLTLVLLGQILAPAEPLSVEASIKAFQLPPGFKIELVASDPQIQSPVAMAFGADGRMWVVEMPDYPNGPAPGKSPEGRIRVLEDKNGDGVFETATTFADGLLFANGLLPWKDGVIVTAAPNIVHLRDTDGDGIADKRDILFEGFATQNPQLRVSHPILGLDGWVYVANGLRGGSVIRAGQKDAQPIAIGGMDFRFNPITLEAEAISGMGQFGNTFDEWGNRFVCDNRNHLRHVVLENRYIRRNPALAVPSLLEDVWTGEPGLLNSGAALYPISRNWTTSNLHAGRFTAACGVLIDRGSALPFRGDAFTCDPTGNLVHREILTPKGVTFTGKSAYDKKEFLASPDDWFRPVFLTHGPDGGLYIVDMHRAVIEHPEFMPPELKNRPDLTLGKNTGRIWRILPTDRKGSVSPNLAKMPSGDLIAMLASDNGWQRMTAHRLILESQNRELVVDLTDTLLTKLDSAKQAVGKVHCMWLLHSLRGWTDRLVGRHLRDEHPRVREHAVRMSELATLIRTIPDDGDARVRFQSVLTAGNDLFETDLVALLGLVAERDGGDHWTRLAIASSVKGHAARLIRRTFQAADPALVFELAVLAGAEASETELALKLLKGRPKDKADVARDRALLLGLAEAMARRGAKLDADDERIRAVFEQAATVTVEKDETLRDRLEAIRLAAYDPVIEPSAARLVRLINADNQSPEIRIKAIQSLSTLSPPGVSDLLLAIWPRSSPGTRQEIANALLLKTDRATALLDAVEKGTIPPRDLDAGTLRRLNSHPQLGKRAAELLKAAQPGDRKKAIERYRAALDMKGDAIKGREVFAKSCAACHKIAGIGQTTGPDISDTRTKTIEQLLTDILDPNAAIDGGAIAYLATTKSGKSYSGLIVAETASSITLRRAEGQSDTILRTDLEELRSTGKSLMPEGLEADIPVERMSDLLAFLKNWRYIESK